MKRCVTCRRSLDLVEFNRKSSARDGLQNVCRDCNRRRARAYYAAHRESHLRVIINRRGEARRTALAFVGSYLLANPCVDCGERDLRVLDFDHRPGAGKTGEVLRLARDGHSLTRIRMEIERCDVRCRNCHARVTAERRPTDWRSETMRRHGLL